MVITCDTISEIQYCYYDDNFHCLRWCCGDLFNDTGLSMSLRIILMVLRVRVIRFEIKHRFVRFFFWNRVTFIKFNALALSQPNLHKRTLDT